MGTVKLPENVTGYIDRLTEVQRERLMTTRLVPCITHTRCRDGQPAGCLVGVAMGGAELVDGKFVGDRPRVMGDWDWGDMNKDGHHLTTAFNILAVKNREGTEQAIRDYIVELRLKRGGTVPEPALVEKMGTQENDLVRYAIKA